MNQRLAKIAADLTSPNAGIRGRGMQELLLWARKDPSIHRQALPIFRQFADSASDPWTSVSAACGVELISGPAVAGALWRGLLNHPDIQIARHASLAIINPVYVRDLLQTLQVRSDPTLRQCILRTLGRLKDPVAFPALVDALADPELRADAIEGLGDLYDIRAIGHLEPFLNDNTQTGYVDNHGPPLLISDVAGAAISRINLHNGRSLNYKPLEINPTTPPAEAAPIAYESHPPLAKATRWHWQAFVPIIALLIDGVLFAAVSFLIIGWGQQASGSNDARALNALMLLPPLVGLGFGVITLTDRHLVHGSEWIVFALGMGGCGLCVLAFGYAAMV